MAMNAEPEQSSSGLGRKVLALGVLIVASYILLKWVVRLAQKFVTLALILLAVIGLIWAFIALRRD
jgi:hypothetical protein